MAKDGTIQPPSVQLDPEEQFWASEEGVFVENLMDRFQKGEITMEEARKQYNSKWGGKAPSGAQSVPMVPLGKF